MKHKVVLFTALLGLSACSSGGGSGGAAPVTTCSASGEAAVNKVQVGDPGVTFDPNTNFALALKTSTGADKEIPAGTKLTAVVRNACEQPGPITTDVERAEEAAGLPGVRSYAYVLMRSMTRSELERLAEQDECVERLADSTIDYASSLPSDPLAKSQGHLAALGGSDAYPVFFDPTLGKRKPVVIAIVDTGVDIDHEDLRETLWVNTDEVPGNGIDDDKNGYIDDVNGFNFASKIGNPKLQGTWKGNYHGTHVAGLAASKGYNGKGVSGVMGAGAKVMALNVFGADPGAFSYHTENAIRYAADNGADVINLSIGGSSASASYKAAIQYAVSKGSSVFAAAGNERRTLGPDYFLTPGAYGESITGMMTVGSVDSSDNAWSAYSNYSPTYVEIAAPGSQDSSNYVGLLSTMPKNAYSRLQGTSMSTPVMSGAAALAIQLLRARGYAATPNRIETIMSESAIAVAELAKKVNGGRILNLKSLADYIASRYPKRAAPEPGVDLSPGEGSAPLVPCT
ncbi:MAG: S8 family serine peptidase [Bdellovibrionaceae bacterium]|nr:S8 family serine peptidase [Pseudobdellovibrionaceae bacterium]